MGIREARRLERQNAVLDAATALIEEQGSRAVTIAAVAKRIGSSVGGMYRYYPTKQAIFVALQLRSIAQFELFLKERLHHAQGRSTLARVVVAFSSWSAFQSVAPSHHRLLDESLSAMERTLDDEQAEAVHFRLQDILKLLAQLLENAVADGMLRAGDPAVRTHLLWSANHGLGHFEKRDHLQPEMLRVNHLGRELYRAFFGAWGAPEDAVEDALTAINS